MQQLVIPTEQEISEIVDQFVAGKGSLSDLLDQSVLRGAPQPETWGEFSQEWKDAWSRAVTMADALGGRGAKNFNRTRRFSTDEMWDAIEASLAEAEPLVRLSWYDLSTRLGCGGRGTEWRSRKLGFRFTGQQSQRVVAKGPCRCCGKVYPAYAMTGGLAPGHKRETGSRDSEEDAAA